MSKDQTVYLGGLQITYSVRPGGRIDNAILELIELASAVNYPLEIEFNSHTLKAEPKASLSEKVDLYHRLKRDYWEVMDKRAENSLENVQMK